MKEEKSSTPLVGGGETLDTASQLRPSVLVGNLGEPIKLTGVNLGGFSTEAARPGNMVKVWTRLALTSDDPVFHKIVENLGRVIAHLTKEAGEQVNLSRASSVLLVVRPDDTAELWMDTAAVSMNILLKRDMQAGSVVFESDIADVTELNFPCVDIGPKDKVLYLFREDWRFALFFDFNPDGDLALNQMTRSLGTLYRSLKYRHLYDTLANSVTFERLIKVGWFPFVEIIGSEFKALSSACEVGFSLDEAESQLLKNFDDERLDRMFARWIAKPHFKQKEQILKSALNSYKAKESVAVIKIILTEIEGVLAEAYNIATGKRAKLQQLIKFAKETAERKSGGSDTLLFPIAFAEYLENHTYANFDPNIQDGEAGSRHAVGHGAAKAKSYTQPRALQALLTLDQFAFYT